MKTKVQEQGRKDGKPGNFKSPIFSLQLPLADSVAEHLSALFRRNGYVRPPAEKRLAGLGYGRFRRGYEFRLTAESRSELRLIRNLLRQAGFTPGRPFAKGRQFRQPVYGRAELERFLDLIDKQNA